MIIKSLYGKQAIPIDAVKHYVKELFEGLEQMHSRGVCHRDLKPENILLKNVEDFKLSKFDVRNFKVKIADVGSSKQLEIEESKNTPYVVSRFYRAPELILGAKHYDTSIDIWAAGVIMFELLTRTPLFPGEDEGIQIYEYAQVLGHPTAKDKTYLV